MRVQRSQEVEEIIGTPASWLTRNGTWVLAAVTLSLTLLASFYSYPTTVSGDLLLTTVDPPRQLAARQDIEIQRVLVADGEEVEAGQFILVAKQGSVKWEHVQYVDEQLIAIDSARADNLVDLKIPTTLTLGSLQDAVYTFLDRQELYRSLRGRRLEQYTTRELQEKITTADRSVESMQAEGEELQRSLELARAQLEQEEGLATNGTRYTERINAARRRAERAEEALQSHYANLRAARFEIEMMRNQIDAYRSGKQGSSEEAGKQLLQAYEDLAAAVATWNRNFTTTSPVSGTVVLNPAITEDSHVPEGELLATVFPLNAGSTLGRVEVDVLGSGRLEIGQRVVIEFPKWPALSYGTVAGRIDEIGLVPVDGKVPVLVSFPQGLVTSTGFTISPEPFLRGEASIIIDKRPLIRRLLGF
ncbi:HlyD family efflux transporter periplasmic adaptor subunit [Lewinella sp. IMCC34191]|uniref:HlyD family efflux transporter periplasmic adaptor subunit n=1 Tax=Lewinella sp. IMCC34191 TaxID=2259172 RepID=UPI000E236588|nr:HlyD family efflux transporter periplasmic adaptor subunit [Lewinella sp. IMCC34191]